MNQADWDIRAKKHISIQKGSRGRGANDEHARESQEGLILPRAAGRILSAPERVGGLRRAEHRRGGLARLPG